MNLKYNKIRQEHKDNLKKKYPYLTDVDIEDFIYTIWNGVGSSEFPILPKSYIFCGPSLIHDYDYYARGGIKEFFIANIDFFKNGLYEVKQNNYKLFYGFILILYTIGLMIFGTVAFEWGKKCNSYSELKQVWLNNENRSKLNPLKIAKYLKLRIKL